MKVRLTFKSGKKLIEKDVELSSYVLMSLLTDETIIEIVKQVGDEVYQSYGHLFAITDIDDIK